MSHKHVLSLLDQAAACDPHAAAQADAFYRQETAPAWAAYVMAVAPLHSAHLAQIVPLREAWEAARAAWKPNDPTQRKRPGPPGYAVLRRQTAPMRAVFAQAYTPLWTKYWADTAAARGRYRARLHAIIACWRVAKTAEAARAPGHGG